MDYWLFFLALASVSFIASVLGAMLGLGGGVIVVPVLSIMLGIDIRYAMGASIVAVIVTSCTGAAAYVRERVANMRLGMFLELGTTAGGVTGSLIASILSGRALSVIFGLVIAYSAYVMFRKRHQEAPAAVQADALAERLRLNSVYHDVALGHAVPYNVTNTLPVLGVCYVAGTVSGLLGIGGGPLQVPAMDLLMRLPIKVASATSMFVIGVTATASAGVYLMRGQVHPMMAAPVALGALAGTLVGCRLMARVRSSLLRLIFVGLLAVLSLQMLARGLL